MDFVTIELQTYKNFSEHHRAIIDDLEEPIRDLLLEGLALGSILTSWLRTCSKIDTTSAGGGRRL